MSSHGLLLGGRYRLESLIAAGGVGEVWRAGDLVLGRPVAVKMLREGYASHPQTLARFHAEARHAGSLTHPGIAQVYDYGEAGAAGAPYMVLELVEGPSLAGVLDGGPLDPAAVMDVVAQVAAALAAAHAASLIHRDVKPANLLMSPDGLVKITDFGIAHVAGSAPITHVGTLVGTPAYLAPERAAGEPATPASDLYSLGIVAYECLAGALPFRGTPMEIAWASRYQPLPPLSPATPPAVAELIAELTAKDPGTRPGSSGEVAARAARLRDTMNGDPGLTQPERAAFRSPARADTHTAVLTEEPPPGERLDWSSGWAAHRRPRRGVWLAVLAAAALAALTGWLVASIAGAQARRPAPASPPASTRGPAVVNLGDAALVGKPVGTVLRQLAGLGLRSRVIRSASGSQPPGTVISLQPSGQVTEGSVITVTIAVAPPGHRRHHHQGNDHHQAPGGGQGGD